VFRFRLLAVVALAALAAAGCSSAVMIARQPVIYSEVPPDFPRLPLRVALVRTTAMREFPNPFTGFKNLGKQMADAAMQGMLAGAQLAVSQADLLDEAPTAGYDLICTPVNPYFDWQPDMHRRGVFTLSMEVVVRDPRSGAERGMLLEAEGKPGHRPKALIEARPVDGGPSKKAGLIGPPFRASDFEEAANHALFFLGVDFAEKLRKRGEQMLAERAGTAP
jgi:hypothetical protein